MQPKKELPWISYLQKTLNKDVVRVSNMAYGTSLSKIEKKALLPDAANAVHVLVVHNSLTPHELNR